MEVTRENFQEVLAELSNILENATFLAIDGEFSGLNSGDKIHSYDTPESAYDKIKQNSMEFLLVQFGLSVFTYKEKTKTYESRSYSFYTFPRAYDQKVRECQFRCQASSIAFLADRGFDFNKLFKCGIPHLSKDDEEKSYRLIEEKYATKESPERIIISESDRGQLEEICASINKFISSNEDVMYVDKCNAFMRKVLCQEVRLRWPNVVSAESAFINGFYCLVVRRIMGSEEEAKRRADMILKDRQEVQEAVGLSLVLRKIADSKKPIIGHNMLLDICHIVHQFFNPLPDDYNQFKQTVHALFPSIIDTKVLSNSKELAKLVKNSTLGNLFDTVNEPPFTMPQEDHVEGRGYTVDEKNLHNAGYDAYITGKCFIALSRQIGSLKGVEHSTILPDSEALDSFVNKLNIIGLKDYPYISLVSDDPVPCRDHVLHLCFRIPPKPDQITNIINRIGGAHIAWASSTTIFVGLYNPKSVDHAKQTIQGMESVSVKKYSSYESFMKKKMVKKNGSMKDDIWNNRIEQQEQQELKGLQKEKVTTSHILSEDADGWEIAAGKRRKKRKGAPIRTATPQKTTKTHEKSFPEDDTW